MSFHRVKNFGAKVRIKLRLWLKINKLFAFTYRWLPALSVSRNELVEAALFPSLAER